VVQVAELKQQLSNEQTVHDILERALHPTSTSARSVVLNIPTFIPSKAKELLAELVLVEEEIVRLESQISTMKGGLAAAQHQRASAVATTTAAYSYPSSVYTNNCNGGGSTAGNGTAPQSPAPPTSGLTRQPADQVAPEIKSMFFISQAMNAEYLKRHLSTDDKQAKSPKDHPTRGSGATVAVSPKFNTVFALPPRTSLDKVINNTCNHIITEPLLNANN
jgi:hypothetical protein